MSKVKVLVVLVLVMALGACVAPEESPSTGEFYTEPPCWYHVEACPEGPTSFEDLDLYCYTLEEAGTVESKPACRSELLSQLQDLVTRMCEGDESCAAEIVEGLNAGEVWFTQEGAYRVPLGD